MERAEQRDVSRSNLHAVAELRSRLDAQLVAGGLVAERAEADDDAQVAKLGDLALQERPAGVALRWERVVARRRALHGGGDPCAAQLQPVAAMIGRRLVGEAGAMHRPVQPVARAVTGEHPPGAVGAVRGGGQSEHEHARLRVAEAGHAATPVVVVAVGGALDHADLLPPSHQAGADAARGDLAGHAAKGGCRHRPVAWQGLMAGTPPTTDG